MDVRSSIQIWLKTNSQSVACELVEALYPQVSSIVRRHLPRRMDVNDLTQEVFAKFFANLHRYDPQKPVENWLSRLTINHCRDQLRREKTRPELRWSDLSITQQSLLAGRASQGDGTGTKGLDAEEARQLIESVLQTLSADDQILLRMLYLEGKSLAEVAEVMNWNRTLTRLKGHRARNRAHKALSQLKLQQQKDFP